MSHLRQAMLFLTFITLCFASAPTCRADAIIIVVPNTLANVEGNTVLFGDEEGGVFHRIQQINAASQFAAFGGPRLITQIAVRPNGSNTNFGSFTFSNLQINLSTTSRAPDGLSNTFAQNIGADEIVARNGPLTVSTALTGPPGGPKAFDIIFPLTTPFLYDPSQGNLLVDFRTSRPLLFVPFDGHNQIGDSVSVIVAGPVGSTTGFALGSTGMVMQFTFSPAPTAVPEPATMLLLGTGLAGIAVNMRRRGKSQRS